MAWAGRHHPPPFLGGVGLALMQTRAPAHTSGGVHVDGQVGGGGGVVPQREGPVPVQQRRDGVDVRHDARHVGRRGERPELPVVVLLWDAEVR